MMSGRRGSAYLATLVTIGCAFVPACKRNRPSGSPPAEEPPCLGSVAVKPIPKVDFRGQEIKLDEERVAASVKNVLDNAHIFSEAKPKRAVVTPSVEIVPFTEGSADALEIGVKFRLRMTIRPEGGAPARYGEDAAALGQAPFQTRDAAEAKAAFQRLAQRTAQDLVRTYVARQKLWSGDTHAIAAALASADDDVRVEALRVIGARKLREHVPAVLRLLVDDDEGVRDAALGSLVALRERGAVKALAESRQMRDAREMRKVLDAIATLGGTEARDYLAFVAATHDDEEIRTMANQALERLTRHAGSFRPTK